MNASLTGTLIIIFSKQVLEHAGAILSALNWEFVCSISILLWAFRHIKPQSSQYKA